MAIIIFGRRVITAFLVLLFIAIQVSAQQKTSSDYLQGKADGERDAKGNPLWFVAGCLPPFGHVAAYLIRPNPPAHALLGKSASYIQGYTDGYKNKSVSKNLKYSSIGTVCVGGLACVVILKEIEISNCPELNCLETCNSTDWNSGSILLSLKSIF